TLLAGVRVALASGLVDDLDWLSQPVAAAALFELASALPAGPEKREIGRRVLQALHEGDATTFVTLARALALGSRRALGGPVVRARVALSMRLPISIGTGPDRLALALLARPELEREWLSLPSTGALPSRRLAARVLERAAREAARRATEHDDSGMRVLDRPNVRAAFARLLSDRESLVWRHVASARGLLSGADPARQDELLRVLTPSHGSTEWRRAAASLAASIAHDPQSALKRCRDLAQSDLARRDPGIAVAMVYGLGRAGEEEPEAAEELLVSLIERGDLEVMEALVDVRREHAGGEFGLYAAGRARARLRASGNSNDDGLVALRAAISDDLAEEDRAVSVTLTRHLSRALIAFAEGREMRSLAETALGAARGTMTELEQLSDNSRAERQRGFFALRELDRGLLESSTLAELLTVCGLEAAAPGAGAPGELLERLGRWLLAREEKRIESPTIEHPVLRLRRLRTLLHLQDVEVAGTDEGSGARHRERRQRALRVLLDRLESDPPSPLRRTLCASLARACDSLVRDELCELSDILIAIAGKIRAAADLDVLAEASMAPEVKEMFRASAEVARALQAVPAQTPAGAPPDRSIIDGFGSLAASLPPGISPRVEGLRRGLLGIARAISRLGQARSLSSLRAGEGATSLEVLEETLQYVAQLCAGSRRRLGLPGGNGIPSVGGAIREVAVAVDRMGADLQEGLRRHCQRAIEVARIDLPGTIADVVVGALARIANLPTEASMEFSVEWAPVGQSERLRLPTWLPPSRIVGGFYVLRPIGTGGGGSVFVARRSEDRHDDEAESYALKIPQFDGPNAHTLTEEQFLQLFREEAGALLTLPPHQNLAGFVTFDARARPKPILVMELVRGPTLERVLEKRELSVGFVFAILDGVAGGLEIMHGGGVGHLDVKPGNIILRETQGLTGSRLVSLDGLSPTPVLVDFGLAGRKVRPGCASPYYGAPEVWDAGVLRYSTGPSAVDVYAYCCLAYELLTGHPLFDAETLPALIQGHLGHDGNPPRLMRLHGDPRFAPLAQVLSAGLTRDPRRRASITQLREALKGMAPHLKKQGWPLPA
ncbi:MAG TPA: protein kinase, partial [Polyangia bacterium]